MYEVEVENNKFFFSHFLQESIPISNTSLNLCRLLILTPLHQYVYSPY